MVTLTDCVVSWPASPPVCLPLLLTFPCSVYYQDCLWLSLCLTLPPHPLFALPLCPQAAQMISALSSHPVDFCGLLTPPHFVPTTHTHTHFLPSLVCDSEYGLTEDYNAMFPLYLITHLVWLRSRKQIHYHGHSH